MNWRDLRPGTVVYHSVFTHWGKGTVLRVEVSNFLENMFEKGARRVIVQFEGRDGETRLENRELRKTPNRKKIKTMIEVYAKRGQVAKDGGDRLILPEKNNG